MTRTLAIVASLAAVVALGLTATADAGHCHRRNSHNHGHHRVHRHHNRVVRTIVQPPVYVQPAPQLHWFFGMNATLTDFGGYRGLQITYVVPGGPAALAGLEAGDVILASNGQGFQAAFSTHQAVALLKQTVQHGLAGSQSTYGNAQLTIRDLRTGGLVSVMTQPYHNVSVGLPTVALR